MITKCTFAEIEAEPNFPILLEEYAAESGMAGMPAPRIDAETYRKMDAAGILHIFAAKVDGLLIGFFCMLATNLPHYNGALVAVSESFFVAKAHRMSGAGVRLLRAVEAKTDELRAQGPLVSARSGSALADVLMRMGYGETNRMFFRGAPTRELVAAARVVPAMSDNAIDKVRRLESLVLQRPQTPIAVNHLLHGGIYSRTAFIPAGEIYTGALIKVPTTLTMHGTALVYIGSSVPLELSGYNVLQASAGRKQVFVTETDVCLTMSFRTDAKTVEEAECEFTDEADFLASRRDGLNYVMITGE